MKKLRLRKWRFRQQAVFEHSDQISKQEQIRQSAASLALDPGAVSEGLSVLREKLDCLDGNILREHLVDLLGWKIVEYLGKLASD